MLGVIITGVLLLAYFRVDIQKFVQNPEVKSKITAGIALIKTGLGLLENRLETATTTATSTAQ